jgi:Domain of unknown function (DUF4136)
MKRYIVLSIAVVGLGACSSQKVNFDYDRRADFSTYKTYAWHQDQDTLADEFPLAHQRFTAAVDVELRAKGLREVESSSDVYVTYYADASENVSIDTDTFGYGYGAGWYWGDMGTASSTTRVRTYTTGTLVVDVWDAKQKLLVWRGIVSDTVSANPRDNQKKLEGAAAKLFEKFPPPRASEFSTLIPTPFEMRMGNP